MNNRLFIDRIRYSTWALVRRQHIQTHFLDNVRILIKCQFTYIYLHIISLKLIQHYGLRSFVSVNDD